jgi:hypothetical protein
MKSPHSIPSRLLRFATLVFFLNDFALFSGLTAQTNPPAQFYQPTSILTNDFNICQGQIPWRLVFQDEFNGTELDHNKWVTYYPYTADGSDQAFVCRASNENNNIYLDENVTVSDGKLHLATKYETAEWYGVTRPYTSGMIFSRSPWTFRRGRFEARCKIPHGTGAPLVWPAFWLFGSVNGAANTSTEIDAFEFCGNERNILKAALHRYYLAGDEEERFSFATQHPRSFDFSDDFHVFAVEWDIFYVRWYIDGNLVRETSSLISLSGSLVTGCEPGAGSYLLEPHFPHYSAFLNVILNSAVSQNGGFCLDWPLFTEDVTSYPYDFQVDWVRIYERQTALNHDLLDTEATNLSATDLSLCQNETSTLTMHGPVGHIEWQVGPGL